MSEMETKDTFMKYANNVTATCAFGLKVNSFENPDNEFMQIAAILQGKDVRANIRMMFLALFVFIARIFKLQLLSSNHSNFPQKPILIRKIEANICAQCYLK